MNCVTGQRDRSGESRNTTYLWYRVCRHQTEDVHLDSLVQLYHRLQLRSVEAGRLLEFYSALECLASKASDEVADIDGKLAAEAMVDVQLALTGGGQISIVDGDRGLDKSLVMSLHGGLARSELPTTVGSSDSTRGGVEFTLEL